MKKILKSLGAVAVCVPVAAFAACGLKPADDPAATYATFAEKYTAAATALATGNAYLDSYMLLTVQAEGENGKVDLSAKQEAAYNITDSVVNTAAFSLTETTAYTSAEGAEDKSSSVLTNYFVDNTIYARTVTTAGEQVSDVKSVSESEAMPMDPASLLISLNADYNTAIAGMQNVVVQTSDDGTQMKLTAEVDPQLLNEYLSLVSGALGDYDFEIKTSIVYSMRFDFAGNLLYTEMETQCWVSIAQPEAPEGDEGGVSAQADGEENDGNEGSESGNEEQTPAAPTPTDHAYVRIYQKTSVKDGNPVKLPTAAQLEAYKEEPATPPEEGGENA